MFSFESDLATGKMVLSQISMSVRALLPHAMSKSFVSQLRPKLKTTGYLVKHLKQLNIVNLFIPLKKVAFL